MYEDLHLHVGYYKNGFDFEGILFKVINKAEWVLYFHAVHYNIILKRHDKRIEPFGYAVRKYKQEEINEMLGNAYFQAFLIEENIITVIYIQRRLR